VYFSTPDADWQAKQGILSTTTKSLAVTQ